MTVETLERIRVLGTELSELRNGKDPLAGLKFESAGLELAILALNALGPSRTAALRGRRRPENELLSQPFPTPLPG